jgi:hypothetical protein
MKLPPTMAGSRVDKALGGGEQALGVQPAMDGTVVGRTAMHHPTSMARRGNFGGREFGGDEDSLRKQGRRAI